MFFNSVPSDERFNSSASNTLRSHSAGSDARRPYPFSERLARTYDRLIEKFADDVEFSLIAIFAGIPVALAAGVALTTGHPFWILMIPLSGFWCYWLALFGVIGLRDKLKERDKRIAEINDSALWRLCESRREECDRLHSEINHLKQDVAHWKAISFAQRGNLDSAGEYSGGTAADSITERVESAAVVKFPRDGDAA